MSWFDLFILIVVAYCSIKGYRSGLAKQLTSFIGIVAAAILSGQISTLIQPFLQQHLQSLDFLIPTLSYILAFTLIILFFYILGRMLDTIIKTIKLGFLNRLGGILFSISKWLVIISIVLNIIIKIDKREQSITTSIAKNSKSYSLIQPIAASIIPFFRS